MKGIHDGMDPFAFEVDDQPLTRQEKRRIRRQVRQGTFRARDHVTPAERVYMGKW